jgi:hypothetical protein
MVMDDKRLADLRDKLEKARRPDDCEDVRDWMGRVAEIVSDILDTLDDDTPPQPESE